MAPGTKGRTPCDPRRAGSYAVIVAIGLAAFACGGASGQDLGSGSDGGGADAAGEGGSSSADGGDGGGASDARAEGGRLTCNLDGGAFPSLTDGCTGNDACVIATHQIDCCGSKIALGLNHAVLNTFQKDEAAWEASCPQCDCAVQPLLAQDGKTGLEQNVRVMCEFTSGNGKCKTYFP